MLFALFALAGCTNLVTIEVDAESTTTIEQGYDNTTVTVNEDNSAWPASGELWIGQECMHYTSRDSGAKTFTVPAAGRGYYSSRVQRHVADAERGWAPRITSAPVA